MGKRNKGTASYTLPQLGSGTYASYPSGPWDSNGGNVNESLQR